MLDIYTVAFFGHRYIDNPFRIEDRLEEEIRRLDREMETIRMGGDERKKQVEDYKTEEKNQHKCAYIQ